MKRWKHAASLLLALTLAGSMVGCGNSKMAMSSEAYDGAYAATEAVADAGWGMNGKVVAEEAMEYADEAEAASVAESPSAPTQVTPQEGDTAVAERKLIRNMNFSLETKEFDALLEVIEQKVNELGGYIEDSTVDGTPENANRHSYLTVRVPADQLEAFEETVGNNATVLSKNTNVRDVTLQYSDLSAHIAALRLEQETLMDMLSKAETVDTIITIQNELTNIRYELESYESQMKILANQVDYSTVSMSIHEVKIASVQEKAGFFSRVKQTFHNSIHDLGEGIEDFLVFVFGNIVGILLFLAIAAGVIYLIRVIFRFMFKKERKVRKKKAKEQQPAEKELKADELKADELKAEELKSDDIKKE